MHVPNLHLLIKRISVRRDLNFTHLSREWADNSILRYKELFTHTYAHVLTLDLQPFLPRLTVNC